MNVRTQTRDSLLPALVGFLLSSTLARAPTPDFTSRMPVGFARERETDPDRMNFRDLQRLPSIGPTRARLIVEARHERGLRGGPAAWTSLAGIGDETVRCVAEAVLLQASRARDR